MGGPLRRVRVDFDELRGHLEPSGRPCAGDVATGDPGWEELLSALHGSFRKRGAGHDAEDLAAEAVLRTIETLAAGPRSVPVRAMAFKIARDLDSDRRRRRQRRAGDSPLTGHEVAVFHAVAGSHRLREALEAKLAGVRERLTERQRELASCVFDFRTRSSLARHVGCNLRDLDASLLAIAKQVWRMDEA